MIAKKRILIVDDSETNRIILKHILESKGYATSEADNGRTALHILENSDEAIDLVLLDLSMPIMNGYELLGVMKEKGLLQTVPVIVQTGSDLENDEMRSLEMGASDFITKPYNAGVICNRIQSILRLVDNAAFISRLRVDRSTGLYNREAFEVYAAKMLGEHPDKAFSMVVCDVDDFKMIKLQYGVELSNEFLHYIVQGHIEFAGDNGICGRLSTDTFALLLGSGRKVRTHEEITKSLIDYYKKAPIKKAFVRYGVYRITDKSVSVASMIDYAQLALDSIKHKYGVYFAEFDDEMRKRVFREHELEEQMEDALADKQFVVHLQPKHCAKTGEISGAAALVRLNSPTLGFVPPSEFISLFERNRFITKLDMYMLREVCGIIKDRIKAGFKPMPISVNLSRVDFIKSDLVKMIEETVDGADIPHNLIHFEVTESIYATNMYDINSAIDALHSSGFLIEMDDFGSGYSSLSALAEMKLDIIKLDMRFFQSRDDGITKEGLNIIRFVLGLAAQLGFPVIAEGVETKEDYELLKGLGCDYIQGYYFSKPMPVDEFNDYASRYNC